MIRIGRALALIALAAAPARAAEHTLIIAGLGGELEYETRFQTQAHAIAQAARFAATDEAHVSVLSGAEATRKSVRLRLADLAQRTSADDVITIVLIGHGSFDGQEYRFNVPGPDLTGTELGKRFDRLPASAQLIVNATSASGAVIERWASPRRVVITATKNGGERTATRFAQYWAQAMTTTAADLDKDGLVTAAEAFDYVRRQVDEAFKADAALPTEHARLEGAGAARLAVARFGAARAFAGVPRMAALLVQRGALELDLDALKARRPTLAQDAYYDALEATLVKLALLQRRIDAVQAELAASGG